MSSLNIPQTCGVMLLPDCTLFPHGGLPLHLFEPRYREMLADTLSGSCFFAVGRLLGKETKNYSRCVAPVGTMGLVRASRELDDGTPRIASRTISAPPKCSTCVYPHCFTQPVYSCAVVTALARRALHDATHQTAPHQQGTRVQSQARLS